MAALTKSTRRLGLLAVLALTLALGATAALADDLVQPDQRLGVLWRRSALLRRR